MAETFKPDTHYEDEAEADAAGIGRLWAQSR